MSTNGRDEDNRHQTDECTHNEPLRTERSQKNKQLDPLNKEEPCFSGCHKPRHSPIKSNDTVAVKTYNLIEMFHLEAPEVASWTKEQNGFIIKDIDTFIKKYYPNSSGETNSGKSANGSHTKYQSFVRQLNNYQFQKVQGTPKDIHEYTHKHGYFCRNEPSLLKKITKKPPKPKNSTLSPESIESKDAKQQIAEQKNTMQKILVCVDHISNRLDDFFEELSANKIAGDTLELTREVSEDGYLSAPDKNSLDNAESLKLDFDEFSLDSFDVPSLSQIEYKQETMEDRLSQIEQNQEAINDRLDLKKQNQETITERMNQIEIRLERVNANIIGSFKIQNETEAYQTESKRPTKKQRILGADGRISSSANENEPRFETSRIPSTQSEEQSEVQSAHHQEGLNAACSGPLKQISPGLSRGGGSMAEMSGSSMFSSADKNAAVAALTEISGTPSAQSGQQSDVKSAHKHDALNVACNSSLVLKGSRLDYAGEPIPWTETDSKVDAYYNSIFSDAEEEDVMNVKNTPVDVANHRKSQGKEPMPSNDDGEQTSTGDGPNKAKQNQEALNERLNNMEQRLHQIENRILKINMDV